MGTPSSYSIALQRLIRVHAVVRHYRERSSVINRLITGLGKPCTTVDQQLSSRVHHADYSLISRNPEVFSLASSPSLPEREQLKSEKHLKFARQQFLMMSWSVSYHVSFILNKNNSGTPQGAYCCRTSPKPIKKHWTLLVITQNNHQHTKLTLVMSNGESC